MAPSEPPNVPRILKTARSKTLDMASSENSRPKAEVDAHDEDEVSNRERILNIAEHLFASKGYHATSVREIVNAASVTSPMLYYYFGSKEELLVTLLEERLASYSARLCKYLEDVTNAEEVILAWCQAFVDETSESSGSLRFVLALLYGPSPDAARATLLTHIRTIQCEFEERIQAYHPEICIERIAFVRESIFNFLDPYLFPVIDGWVDTIGDDVVSTISARIFAMLHDDLPFPEKTMKRNRLLLSAQIEALAGPPASGETP